MFFFPPPHFCQAVLCRKNTKASLIQIAMTESYFLFVQLITAMNMAITLTCPGAEIITH